MTNEEMIKDIDKQIEELKREKERLEEENKIYLHIAKGIIRPLPRIQVNLVEEIKKLHEMMKNYEEGNE